MPLLGYRGKNWLKIFHLVFAILWVGGGLTLVLMQATLKATSGGELYGLLRAAKFVDDFIIIPGAVGSLLTGLLYSVFTNWGFFKHHWITVKWVINIGGVIFGTFWLGEWLNGMPPIAGTLGLEALADPTYNHFHDMNQLWGSVQVSTLVFAVVISVLKPWGKQRSAA